MSKPKAVMSWSSGKDSAFALHRILEAGEFEVAGLLTSLNEEVERVAIHGVRKTLLDAQAAALKLPLILVPLPSPCTNDQYEEAMGKAFDRIVAQGVTHLIFGDLYLEDIRAYREQTLQNTGLTPIFPIWGEPTRRLADEMVSSGMRAIVTCIDTARLDEAFSGRTFDAEFLSDLPDTVDPCGENGEFHTFCFAGPLYREPLVVETGIQHRDGDFLFTDVLFAGSEK